MQLSASSFALSFILLLVSTSVPAMAQSTPDKYVEAVHQAMDFENHFRYSDSVQVVDRALAKSVSEGRLDWEARLLGLRGSVYQRAGKYAEAEANFNRAVAQWTRLNGSNSQDLVGPLAGLGGLYYEAGQYSRAEKLIVRALELQTVGENNNQLVGELHTNLASVYFAQGKDTLAAQEAEAALQRFALLEDGRQGTARDYSVLGAIDVRAGLMPEARSYFEKALALWEAVYGDNNPHTAEGIGDLAIFYLADGQPETAEPLFRKSTETLEAIGGSNSFLAILYIQYEALEKQLGHKKDVKRFEKKLHQLAMTSAQNTISRNLIDVSAFRANENPLRAAVK